MEGAVIGGRKSRLWLCECVHVPLRVFSCGEAEQIRWAGPCSVEGAEGSKRRRMSAAGARMLGWRSDGGEGQSRGEGVALL